MIVRISRVGVLALLLGLALARAEMPAASTGQYSWTNALVRISSTVPTFGSTSEIVGQLGSRPGASARFTYALFAPSRASLKLSQLCVVRTSVLCNELMNLSLVHPARAPPLQHT